MVKLLTWIGLFLLALAPAQAAPIEVTDLAGRTVTIQGPVERFVISEGRYIPLLALLRPHDPVGGLVGMMSPLALTEPALQEQLYEKFPQARDIPLFGGTTAESVSVEKIIDLRPQLAIFGLGDHGPGTKNAELLRQLEASGTAVIFIDFRLDPLNNTLPSVELLGRVFGAEARAADYIAFYRERLERIRLRTAGIANRPSVFVQAHPGRFPCCWGMADGMLGPYVGLVGGHNIADAVAPGPTAQHTEEFLLTENPDVWIGTASGTAEDYRAGKPPVALGADVTPGMAADSLKRYLDQPSFAALDAVRTGRAHSVWHNFYNSPFNIAAVEAFARWVHPDIFADTDPQETLAEIYRRYLPFTPRGTYFATVPYG
jgi:iron complex transport system substrate-binding protein